MTYKLHKLNQGGVNAQGVPLGLVNYMCLNRRASMPRRKRCTYELTEVPNLSRYSGVDIWRSPVLWADLALTQRGKFGGQGFVTINRFEWRRHNARWR